MNNLIQQNTSADASHNLTSSLLDPHITGTLFKCSSFDNAFLIQF